jgi:hypothetical protein
MDDDEQLFELLQQQLKILKKIPPKQFSVILNSILLEVSKDVPGNSYNEASSKKTKEIISKTNFIEKEEK